MISSYVKMSVRSLRAARWRSYLTMLGVVVGVSSVVTIVSIGEGVKQQIIRQVSLAGSDLVTIRPGRLVERDTKGRVIKVNYQNVFHSGTLSETDLQTIRKTPGLSTVLPLGLLSGAPETDGVKSTSSILVGTSHEFPSATNRKIGFGGFFTAFDASAPVAVLGAKAAEDLFRGEAPIGRTFMLRGQEVIVRGVMDPAIPAPQDLGINYDYAIFLPFEFAKEVSGGQIQIYQVLAKPASGKSSIETAAVLNKTLSEAHGGQTDFTILQTADNLAIASNALDLITTFVAAMAGISLLVGGIGIMNIMLVAVSERTHEIGVRKSVGATNSQIRGLFLTEAIIISAVGGVLGVIVSLLANYALRLTTSLEPALDPYLMATAIVGAILLGSIFGLAPAVKAARKDPIEALRRMA